MSALVNSLIRACDELGLKIDLSFVFVLKDGREIRTMARIRHLGAPNGMLLVLSSEELISRLDELMRAGYGCSVLDEPRLDENFNLESFQEMFSDWGWCGDANKKPDWM